MQHDSSLWRPSSTPAAHLETAALMERVLYEVKRIVVGQDAFLERILVALLAQGHLLIEGVPGLAKTLTVNTLAKVLSGQFKRIQFTPDLLPADLVGNRIYNQKTGDFTTLLGPVFANLLLADEINRAPAQVDRFMMKVLVGYPTEEEEYVIVQRVTGPNQDVSAIATTEQLMQLQAQCRKGYVDPALMHFAVRLVSATRDPARYGLPDLARHITFGASPRATIGLIEGARALALLRGRAYALPQDVVDLVPDVLRHRLVLSFEAMSEGLTPDQVIQQILQAVPAPDKPLETHVQISASS